MECCNRHASAEVGQLHALNTGAAAALGLPWLDIKPSMMKCELQAYLCAAALTHALRVEDLERVDAHTRSHPHQAAVVILRSHNAGNMRAVACRRAAAAAPRTVPSVTHRSSLHFSIDAAAVRPLTLALLRLNGCRAAGKACCWCAAVQAYLTVEVAGWVCAVPGYCCGWDDKALAAHIVEVRVRGIHAAVHNSHLQRSSSSSVWIQHNQLLLQQASPNCSDQACIHVVLLWLLDQVAVQRMF